MAEEKAHATYSASGAERWLNCPGSISLSQKAPPQKSSSYADEGTLAHEALETVLKAWIKQDHSPHLRWPLKATKEMTEHAKDAALWIEAEKKKRPKSLVLCETRVALPVSEPGQFGTVDAAIVEEFGRLTVIDYKYGAGLPVYPKENPQLIYYALGIAHQFNYNFEDVELVIIQPRAETDEGTIRTHVMSITELMIWRIRFEDGIHLTKISPDFYQTGKWCKWCPAASICPEISTKALKQARVEFEPVNGSLVLPEPKQLPIKNLSQILDASDKIEDWITKVREHAAHMLELGERVDGYKMVAKRSTRKWVNTDAVATEALLKFGRLAFSEPELLSPAQMEKQVGKKMLGNFVDENTSAVSSGTILVTESDPRPAVTSAQLEFKKETEDPLLLNPHELKKEGGAYHLPESFIKKKKKTNNKNKIKKEKI